MRDEKISDFLSRLADRVPAPGGGAAAALQAAQAAALLGMVGRYTTGEKYAEHAAVIERIIGETDELRSSALRLAEDDAAAFTAVTEAYKLPKDTDEAKAARSAAIAEALVGAAGSRPRSSASRGRPSASPRNCCPSATATSSPTSPPPPRPRGPRRPPPG